MSDRLYCGRKFRTLNIMDEGVRECLGIEVDTSLPAARVVRTLDQIKQWRGLPAAIRCDNGPEFTSIKFMAWWLESGVKTPCPYIACLPNQERPKGRGIKPSFVSFSPTKTSIPFRFHNISQDYHPFPWN